MIDSLLGRAFLVVFATVVSAAVFTLLFPVNRWVSASELRLGIIIALGLVAGITARRFLTFRTALLRFSVAAAAILAALAATYPITAGYLGLNLSRSNPLDPDWQGLAQAGLALAAALLPLVLQRRAGRADMKSRSRNQNTIAVPGSLPRSSSAGRGNSAVRVSTNSRRRAARSLRIRANSTASGGNGVLAAPRRWLRENLTRGVKVGGRARRPIMLRWRRKRPLRLSAVQQHRCPYCLEVVDRNDPRGIKVCRVCKTQHHADCWEVTGTCQVAHYEN
jgi:hypothetical protein